MDRIPHDLTFITNEEGKTLLDRFKELIKDTKFFDVLVGFFYASGFYKLYKSLESAEKIRILVGIGTNRDIVEMINEAKLNIFSHKETKENFEKEIVNEMEEVEENSQIEEGILKFIDWIKNGKLEIRAYPSKNIHSKLYIMTFKEGDRDIGRVITGSSNFTASGLTENLEFNVEIKNRSDYEFALKKFNELWEDSVDVSDVYIKAIKEKTWLKEDITPYELYLKLLYEHFKEELNIEEKLSEKYLPEGFKKLEYQEQAVLNAKKILEEFSGVFLSDVVGLGKTYMAAMLVRELSGRTMVIAPPSLIDRKNPGSWPNVFMGFNVNASFFSIGKLEDAIRELDRIEYENVIVDEAHRFREEDTKRYEDLAQICRGKKVILVTATPYNNSPKDILNQIKLFQSPKKSTIPNLPNLERFFNKLEEKLKKIDKNKNYEKYISVVKENAKEIREKILKYIMIRRTRNEIAKYFIKDVEKEGIKFPEVEDPKPFFYELNEEENKTFDETIELIAKKFKYTRYTPLLYLKRKLTQPEELSQENMGKFMRILLVKRLESSFYAFKNSINRFIKSYEMFLKGFEMGSVYVSKKYSNKIFELLERNDLEEIQRLIDEDKAKRYESKDFNENFKRDLINDLNTLREIKGKWSKIKRDPKFEKLIYELLNNKLLAGKKLIIFTESKETAEYLHKKLTEKVGNKVLLFTGNSAEKVKEEVISNFDANVQNPEDKYQILVTTEVLSEGVNLHRSNIIINYDIPWNPTKMMQRAGRINRIGTKFDNIYTFNFFPTSKAENEINLRKIAESKINGFLTLLGGDAAILTEGEPVTSHELFNKLLSKKSVTGEDVEEESQLKYLNVIKEIREKNPELFNKIKRLPKKARSSKILNPREFKDYANGCITFFKWGKLQKFFITTEKNITEELDFLKTAKIFECGAKEKREKIGSNFYPLFEKNKEAFKESTTEEFLFEKRRGNKSSYKVLKILSITLKNAKKFTEEQENFLKRVMEKLESGDIPKKTVKKVKRAFENLKDDITNPMVVLATLKKEVPEKLLLDHYAEQIRKMKERKEVILSLYLKGVESE